MLSWLSSCAETETVKRQVPPGHPTKGLGRMLVVYWFKAQNFSMVAHQYIYQLLNNFLVWGETCFSGVFLAAERFFFPLFSGVGHRQQPVCRGWSADSCGLHHYGPWVSGVLWCHQGKSVHAALGRKKKEHLSTFNRLQIQLMYKVTGSIRWQYCFYLIKCLLMSMYCHRLPHTWALPELKCKRNDGWSHQRETGPREPWPCH